MNKIECKSCGSNEIIKKSDRYVCIYCNNIYTLESNYGIKKEVVVDLKSDIQNLLMKCRDDPRNKHRYANLILDIDPSNQEVKQYLR